MEPDTPEPRRFEARSEGRATSMTRRLFLGHCATALAAGAHPLLAAKPAVGPVPRGFTIQALGLITHVPLEEMEAFYGGRLGFRTRLEDGVLAVEGRSWSVRFEHAPGVAAHYHFAFNIPENQIVEAHDWCRPRVELIRPPEFLWDAGMPRDVVAFRHWNAHSVFFWDPAGSAVEFISRHTLRNHSARPFGVESAERISEIGLVVDDVPAAAAGLRANLGVETYVRASPGFEPLGNEDGLLLVMQAGQPMAFGRGRARAPYATQVRLAGTRRDGDLTVSGYPYSLIDVGRS